MEIKQLRYLYVQKLERVGQRAGHVLRAHSGSYVHVGKAFDSQGMHRISADMEHYKTTRRKHRQRKRSSSQN